MKIMLSIVLAINTINASEHNPGQPIDNNAYNVHEFTGQAIALDTDAHCKEFILSGKATRIHNAWRQVQTLLNEMATKGSIPNDATFCIVITWRNANFTRIVIAHKQDK